MIVIIIIIYNCVIGFKLASFHLYIIIIIIKTSCTGPIVKYKVIYKLLSQLHEYLCEEKLKKTQLREAPTVDCSLEPIQRSDVKHSVGKVIPHSNLSRQEKSSKLGRSTP